MIAIKISDYFAEFAKLTQPFEQMRLVARPSSRRFATMPSRPKLQATVEKGD
jgi:hypothetical protein